MHNFELVELARKLENIIRIGTLSFIDEANKQVRVTIGDNTTALLPWPCEMGRNFVRWRPLQVGQQVIITCPSGDMAQAVIVGMLYTSALDSPSVNPELDLIEFTDGAQISYNVDTHALKAVLPAGATTELVSTGGINIVGDVTLIGNLMQTGSITSTSDIIANGISLDNHTHTGDSGGVTGVPQ